MNIMSPVPLSSSYYILTLSVICYWRDASQHGIYLLNVSRALANNDLFHSYFAVSVIQVWRLINCCSGICDYCFLSYIVSCILDYKKLIILLWLNFYQLCSLKLQTVLKSIQLPKYLEAVHNKLLSYVIITSFL